MDILEVLKRRAVVGHRGHPARELENTIPSIKSALARGADIIELDVQKTADGVLILSHDETLERTFGVSINIRNATWEEVRRISRGKYRVATLREALEEIAEKAGVFIEVKHPQDAPAAEETVKELGARRWVALISFYDDALKGDLVKGLIYAKPPGRVIDAKRLECQIVLPRYNLATERAIQLAHRLGLYVVAWTVNDIKTAEELWRRGVDGVATDDVELLKKVS